MDENIRYIKLILMLLFRIKEELIEKPMDANERADDTEKETSNVKVAINNVVENQQ